MSKIVDTSTLEEYFQIKWIVDHTYGGVAESPYLHIPVLTYDNILRHKTLLEDHKRDLDKRIRENIYFYQKYENADSYDMYELLSVKGVGLNTFILLYHFMLNEFPEEEILLKYTFLEILKGERVLGYDPQGNTVFQKSHFFSQLSRMFNIDKGLVKDIIEQLIEDKSITVVEGGYLIYTPYYHNERGLLALAQSHTVKKWPVVDYAIETVDDEYRRVRDIVSWSANTIEVLQAPGGHGKTHTVAEAFNNTNLTIIGLTPTGKAATVLRKQLWNHLGVGVACSTFHSAFYRYCIAPSDEEEVPRVHKIIVDEASMLSSKTLGMLWAIRANLGHPQIIFLGDMYQCSPVESGHPFRDLIESMDEDLHTLSKNFRTKDQELVKFLRDVREGCASESPKRIENVLNKNPFLHNLQDEILHTHAFIGANTQEIVDGDIQFLSYTNRAVESFNEVILMALLDDEDQIDIFKIRNNDKTPNNVKDLIHLISNGGRVVKLDNEREYGVQKIDVSNGDTFKVQMALGDEKKLRAYVKGTKNYGMIRNIEIILISEDDGDVYTTIAYSQLRKDFKPAYCMTVHKAQGSGFKKVVYFIEGRRHGEPMDVIYTGITRAIESLQIWKKVGTEIKALVPKDRVTLKTIMAEEE